MDDIQETSGDDDMSDSNDDDTSSLSEADNFASQLLPSTCVIHDNVKMIPKTDAQARA